jgi:hypothetical protein
MDKTKKIPHAAKLEGVPSSTEAPFTAEGDQAQEQQELSPEEKRTLVAAQDADFEHWKERFYAQQAKKAQAQEPLKIPPPWYLQSKSFRLPAYDEILLFLEDVEIHLVGEIVGPKLEASMSPDQQRQASAKSHLFQSLALCHLEAGRRLSLAATFIRALSDLHEPYQLVRTSARGALDCEALAKLAWVQEQTQQTPL